MLSRSDTEKMQAQLKAVSAEIRALAARLEVIDSDLMKIAEKLA